MFFLKIWEAFGCHTVRALEVREVEIEMWSILASLHDMPGR